jgi:hypothetical protein
MSPELEPLDKKKAAKTLDDRMGSGIMRLKDNNYPVQVSGPSAAMGGA